MRRPRALALLALSALGALPALSGCGGGGAGRRGTLTGTGSTAFFTPLTRHQADQLSRGQVRLQKRDAAGAIEVLAALVRADADFDAARYAYAVALTQARREADALAQLAVVLAHDPVHFGPLAMADHHLEALRSELRLAHLVRDARAAFAARARRAGLRFVARSPAMAELRAQGREEIYQLDLGTGRYLRLSDAGTRGVIGALAVSADGRWLLYTRHRSSLGREPLRDLALVVVDLATGVQRAPVPVPWDAHRIEIGWDSGGNFWGETRTELGSIPEVQWPEYEVDSQEEYGTRRFSLDPEGGLTPERRARAAARGGLLLSWLSRSTLPPPGDSSGSGAAAASAPAPGVWFQGNELRLPAGRLLTLPDHGADAALSPDGRWLAFSLKRDPCDLSPSIGDQDNVLYLLDLRTLTLKPLARGRNLYHKTWLGPVHLVYEVGAEPALMRLRVHQIGVATDLAIGPETPVALAPLPYYSGGCQSPDD